jgi:tetratricopeptide (TPR) repeat protein
MTEPSLPDVIDLRARWQVHLRRGVRSLEVGQHDRAARHFAAAYRLAPERPEVCLALGRECLRRGQLVQAEPLLRRAWNGNPNLAAAAAALARLLGVGKGEVKAARQILDEGMRRHPDHALLRVVLGELELEEEHYEAARVAFEQALELGADVQAVRSGLARTYNAEGIACGDDAADDRAIFAFKRASDLDPAWSGPMVNLGVAFARLGRQRRARSCYERAIAVEPDNPVAFFNLGNLLRDQRDPAGAIECYERVLELSPEYPGVRAALADALADQGRYPRAIALYREAIDTEEETAQLWGNLGLALIAEGDEDEGEHCLRRSLELDPASFCSCCNLAALLVCQGRYREATRFAAKAKAIDPDRARQWFQGTGTRAGRLGELDGPLPLELPVESGAPAQEPTNTNG